MNPTNDNTPLLQLLTEYPARIAALASGLSAEQCRLRPAPDAWSLVEILAHLRSCGDVWGAAIAEILTHDHPTFRALDPRSWTERTNYRELDFSDSLRAFTAQRAALVKQLAALPEAAWQRGATVTGAGKPLERTLLFYAQWLARHERSHWKSIARLAADLKSRL